MLITLHSSRLVLLIKTVLHIFAFVLDYRLVLLTEIIALCLHLLLFGCMRFREFEIKNTFVRLFVRASTNCMVVHILYLDTHKSLLTVELYQIWFPTSISFACIGKNILHKIVLFFWPKYISAYLKFVRSKKCIQLVNRAIRHFRLCR